MVPKTGRCCRCPGGAGPARMPRGAAPPHVPDAYISGRAASLGTFTVPLATSSGMDGSVCMSSLTVTSS